MRATASRGPVIGLDRHGGTERTSSTSVVTLFADLQKVVERKFEVRLKPWYGYRLQPRARQEMRRTWLRECDLVVSTDGELLQDRRALGLDMPIVLFGIGCLPRGAPHLRHGFPLLRRQDVLAISCLADQKIFQRYFDDCPAQQALLPFGIDNQVFAPSPKEEREAFRRRLGVRPDEVLFLYVGRITAEKSVHTLLTLMADLMRKRPKVKLAIAGPFSDVPFKEFGTGPFDMDSLFQQIFDARPELRARTVLFDNVLPVNLPSVYGAADVQLNLTRHGDENFGYAQVEGMSCGLPVIGADWGGLQDTIRHGETGFRVPVFVTGRGIQHDLYQAYQYCEALAGSPSLRRRMGAAGRAVACAEYSMERFEKNVIALMDQTLRRPRAGKTEVVLSQFGRRFAREFQVGGRAVDPLFTARTYPLYEHLIEPYTTGFAQARLDPPGAVLFSTMASHTLRGDRLEVVDVVWPASLRLAADEGRLLRWYVREAARRELPYIPVAEARQALRGSLPAPGFDAAVRGLVRKGVMMTSAGAPAEALR